MLDLIALCLTVYFVQTCGHNYGGECPLIDYDKEISKETILFNSIGQLIHCATLSYSANFFSAASDFLFKRSPANTTKPALINIAINLKAQQESKEKSLNQLLTSV